MSRVASLSVVLVALAGCEADEWFGGLNDTGFPVGDTGGDTTGGTSTIAEPIAAADFARALGIAWYDADVALATPLRVIVRGHTGERVGAFEVEAGQGGGGVARYTDVSGGAAEVTYALIDGGRSQGGPAIVSGEVRAAGVTVRVETRIDGSAGGDLVREQTYFALLPDGALTPVIGGLRLSDVGTEAVLNVVVDGAPVVEQADVLAWLVQVGAGAILTDAHLVRLAAIQQDANLMTAVAEELERLQDAAGGYTGELKDNATVEQAVHTSPLCSYVLGFLSAGSGIVCGVCATSVLAAPVTSGGSGILAIPACSACLWSGGVAVVDGLACATSYLRRTTDDYCSNEHICDHTWQGAAVTDDGHGCYCECVEQRCENWCSQQANARSIPIGGTIAGACSATRGSAPCICNLDLNAFCARMAPTTFCSGATDLGNGVNCPGACGNDIVETACPANPSYREQCEPNLPGGCGTGQVCDPMTCQCRAPVCGNGMKELDEQCDFFPGSSTDFGCAAGLTCSRTCTCEPVQTCGNLQLDAGETCDPSSSAANGGCPDGQECTILCACQDRPDTCGDGVCDAERGEQETCPADCTATCGDGVCNTGAGEPSSCPADCSSVSCCEETGGCPSEERYSCPGSCCCCPSGAVCVGAPGGWTCGF